MLKTISPRLSYVTRPIIAVSLVAILMHATAGFAVQGGALEGSWAETDTRDDAGTFPVLLTFTRDLDQSHPKRGEAIATYVNQIVQLQPTGHGAWRQTGDNQYAITLWFLDVNGTYVAAHVHKAITLSDDQTAYTGTFQTQVLDSQGNVLQTVTGTLAGCRIPTPGTSLSSLVVPGSKLC